MVLKKIWSFFLGNRKNITIGSVVTLHPDDIFLVSYPRSGNTYARFLLANLLRYDKREPVDFHSIHRVIPDIEIETHREMLRTMSPPRFIKSHSLYDSRLRRVIYILRDGRDVMVSYYYYLIGEDRFKGSFLDFLKTKNLYPCLWHEHVESWLRHKNKLDLLLIRYEDLLRQPKIELEKMARFARLPCDKARLQWAIINSSFDTMRKIERKKGRAFGSPESFKFIRKGIVGDWKNHFDSPHKEVFKKYANHTLLRLGYVDKEDW